MNKYGVYILILLISLISCNNNMEEIPPCVNGDCTATFEYGDYLDGNGYTHIDLKWEGSYLPYFLIKTTANPTSPIYRYNGRSFVTARFESDTYWEIGNKLVYRVDFFNPFQSDRTSRSIELPTRSEDLELDFFKGLIVNIAQSNDLYYAPTNNDLEIVTKKQIGPFPPEMEGDTLTVYVEVFWDALPTLITKVYKLPIIIE